MESDAQVGSAVAGGENQSRRSALAKLGVGAAAIWAAPTVTTLSGSAVAAASQPGPTTTQPQETTTTTTTAPAETTTTTAPPETTTTTAPTGPVLDFNQPSPSSGYTILYTPSPTYSLGAWQAFAAGRTGDLVRLELMTRIQAAGAGPVNVEIHAADPVTGYPVGPAIGSAQIAERAPQPAPAPPVATAVEFSPPVPVAQGSTYVVVISKASTTSTSWELSFGPLTGFAFLQKYSFNAEPTVFGPYTLYMKTYVA